MTGRQNVSRLGRLYDVWIDGSSVPITVIVEAQEDHRAEEHEAIMFARDVGETWQHGKILRKSERGPLVRIKEPQP